MFQLVPAAYCTITLHLGEEADPTHQRYEPGICKGEAVLMNPNSNSQIEGGSRYQKYFLNKCNKLFATGNVYEVTGTGQHAEDGRYPAWFV